MSNKAVAHIILGSTDIEQFLERTLPYVRYVTLVSDWISFSLRFLPCSGDGDNYWPELFHWINKMLRT